MDLLGARAKESRNEEPAHPAIAIRAVGGEAEAVLLARLHPPQGQGTEPFGPLGAELRDPKGLFNTRLDSKTVRAIDFHEGDAINASALKALILEGACRNRS